MRRQAPLVFAIIALILPCSAVAATTHESVDATGINHFTVTETPDRVRLVDEDGNAYSLRGAIWFGGRADQILTATHMFNIVGAGGVSDSIRLVERFRFGELISRDFGTCELP